MILLRCSGLVKESLEIRKPFVVSTLVILDVSLSAVGKESLELADLIRDENGTFV